MRNRGERAPYGGQAARSVAAKKAAALALGRAGGTLAAQSGQRAGWRCCGRGG